MSRGIVIGSGGSAIQIGDVTFDDKHLEVNEGYLICDGSSIDPVEYEELFNILKPTSSSTTATLLKYPFTAYIRSGLKYGNGVIPSYTFTCRCEMVDTNHNIIQNLVNVTYTRAYNTVFKLPSYSVDSQKVINGVTWTFKSFINADGTPYVPTSFAVNPSNDGQMFIVYAVYTDGDPYEGLLTNRAALSLSDTINSGHLQTSNMSCHTFNNTINDALIVLDFDTDAPTLKKNVYSLARNEMFTVPFDEYNNWGLNYIYQDEQSYNYIIYGYNGRFVSTDLNTWVDRGRYVDSHYPQWWRTCIPLDYRTLVMGQGLIDYGYGTRSSVASVFYNITSADCTSGMVIQEGECYASSNLFLGFHNGKYRFVSNYANSSEVPSNSQISVFAEVNRIGDGSTLTAVRKDISTIYGGNNVAQNPEYIIWCEHINKWVIITSDMNILLANWDFSAVEYTAHPVDTGWQLQDVTMKYGLIAVQSYHTDDGINYKYRIHTSTNGRNWFEVAGSPFNAQNTRGGYVGGFYNGKYYITHPNLDISVYNLFDDQD